MVACIKSALCGTTLYNLRFYELFVILGQRLRAGRCFPVKYSWGSPSVWLAPQRLDYSDSNLGVRRMSSASSNQGLDLCSIWHASQAFFCYFPPPSCILYLHPSSQTAWADGLPFFYFLLIFRTFGWFGSEFSGSQTLSLMRGRWR